VLVICPEGKHQIYVFALIHVYIRICPRIQLPVSAQHWSQGLYMDQNTRKDPIMVHKEMHKIVFQSN